MNLTSQIFSKYLGDTEASHAFSDEILIKKILAFEVALAHVQADLKIIPQSAAEEIVSLITKIKVDPSQLADGTLQNGVPVVTLLEIVKSQLSSDHAEYLHFGATSQDAMDTALVLMLRDSIGAIGIKLSGVIKNLTTLSERYGDAPCMARTRGQLAIPTLFKHKVAAWLDPLSRQEQRLVALATGALKIQLGGAVGDLSAYREKGPEVQTALASALGLESAPSWHTQRDNLCEITNWMAVTSGILGKMGADILAMSQSEVGELVENVEGGGKSSAMAHKNNPALSEALVALARISAGLQSIQLMSLVHANERDATAWILEWKCIPELVMNTATGLNHALTIATKMKINTDRMSQNVAEFKRNKGI